MGKTFRRDDRWKKDRRDMNFKKSKKFKDINKYGIKPTKQNPSGINSGESNDNLLDIDNFDNF